MCNEKKTNETPNENEIKNDETKKQNDSQKSKTNQVEEFNPLIVAWP